MLYSLRLTVVSVVCLSCLASAFSTLFVTEEAGEGRKTEGTEKRTLKTEGNNVAESKVIVETIPFFTDIFTKVEDVMNLTPLKVATIISAQHLINTVKNIPVSGNLPLDNLNMFSNIVDEFNKTTQIIKLTAEYVNISSHYMLDSLNQFAKYNCDEEYVKNIMKTINKNILEVISNHVKVAIREITEKTENRELTGTDVLVSSAYHIVAAFQEMTNQVISLKIDSDKCNPSKPQMNSDISKHDKTHKSIKKDQALPGGRPVFANQESLRDTLTIESIDRNPDLTVEIFSRESLSSKKNVQELSVNEEVKIPESLKVAFISDTNTPKFEITKSNKVANTLQPQFDSHKIIKKNRQNSGNIFPFTNKNPQDELALEIFSPQNIENLNTQKSLNENKQNNQKNLESFKVFYYPLKTSEQSNSRGPGDLNLQSQPQRYNTEVGGKTLKKVITPFKILSLFGNSNFMNGKPYQKKESPVMKAEGSQTNMKQYEDILNRQDLTVEVFSPEAFMHNGKDESSGEPRQMILDLSGKKDIKAALEGELKFGDFKDNYLLKNNQKHFNRKTSKIRNLDRELASSAIDSLSNVPPNSYETGDKNQKGKKALKTKLNIQQDFSTVLMPWGKGPQQYQNAKKVNKNQSKHGLCDDRVEPVCGIDRNKGNFIIFPNDCQRKHHNNVYKTSYEWAKMDTCIGFLLKYNAGKPTKYTNINPQ